MGRPTVVTLPGDGIGPVVLEQALRVLDAVGFEADYRQADIGWEFWRRHGQALPESTVELLREHGVGLFGAITSKSNREAEAELDPALRGKGHAYYSPILGLRQRFDLDLCVRPCRSFAGNPLNQVRRHADASVEEPQLDVVVFRQNTEGLYAGVEWTDPPPAVRAALALHPRFEPYRHVPGTDLALSLRVVTRRATRRILRAAFAYARGHGRRSVTLCEKSNVLRETGGMFEEEAQAVAAEYPDVPWRSVNVDALMMWLSRRPEDFDVIVAGNLFGDIVSDAFAGLVGGLGFAASGNLGERVAIFEPTHGSAPRLAALDPSLANPIAAILAGAMMLDHLGEDEKAERVRAAVARVVAEGRVRTYDMLRLRGDRDDPGRGAATTAQMTQAILEGLGS